MRLCPDTAHMWIIEVCIIKVVLIHIAVWEWPPAAADKGAIQRDSGSAEHRVGRHTHRGSDHDAHPLQQTHLPAAQLPCQHWKGDTRGNGGQNIIM